MSTRSMSSPETISAPAEASEPEERPRADGSGGADAAREVVSSSAGAWSGGQGAGPASATAQIHSGRSNSWRRWLPVLIVIAAVGTAALIELTGPEVQPATPPISLPFVRSAPVTAQPVQLRVTTHGSVVPRTESELIPEVSGSVTWVSPALVSGGFFSRDELLLRIDPVDARVEVERAKAQLERARAEAIRASRELERREGLAKRNVASATELDQAVSAERVATANLREAKAMLQAAEKNLARTELRAPFDGRVRDERVDLGQFVSRGTRLATLYAIDFAEVRVPIPDRELAFLDLPLLYRAPEVPSVAPEDPSEGSGAEGLNSTPETSSSGAPPSPEGSDPAAEARPKVAAPVPPGTVYLRARFAGGEHRWTGRVVRTEGELDPKTRMVNVIARVPDPYTRVGDRPPLAVGLFVDVEILGDYLPRAFVVPRTSLRDDRHVWVIDDDDRLRSREVEVLRIDGDQAVITAGLKDGERISVAALDIAVDGMRVRTERESGS